MSCAPITLVTWTMNPWLIVVKTIHTFPREKAWVETKTRLNWACLTPKMLDIALLFVLSFICCYY